MEKCMNMSDYFVGDMLPEDIVILDGGKHTVIYSCEEAAAHAINTHDELVAMNKELLAALECAEGFVSEVSEKTGFGQVHTLKVIRSAIAKAKAAS